MTRRRRWFASLAAIALLSPAPSAALSVTPDPMEFDLSGVGPVNILRGEVDFLGMATGLPAGGSVLDGSVGASDVSLLFDVSVSSDSDFFLVDIVLIAFDPTVTAVGSLPGAGIGFSGTVSPTVADFVFLEQLDPGEATNPFFVSFSGLAPGDLLQFETVFGLLDSVTVVPEPATASLLGLGVAVLAARRRRR